MRKKNTEKPKTSNFFAETIQAKPLQTNISKVLKEKKSQSNILKPEKTYLKRR